jgi:hypothetical protein
MIDFDSNFFATSLGTFGRRECTHSDLQSHEPVLPRFLSRVGGMPFLSRVSFRLGCSLFSRQWRAAIHDPIHDRRNKNLLGLKSICPMGKCTHLPSWQNRTRSHAGPGECRIVGQRVSIRIAFHSSRSRTPREQLSSHKIVRFPSCENAFGSLCTRPRLFSDKGWTLALAPSSRCTQLTQIRLR